MFLKCSWLKNYKFSYATKLGRKIADEFYVGLKTEKSYKN